MKQRTPSRKTRGFGAITAIFVLVIMALFAAAMVSFTSLQQTTSAQDILSARAWQATHAGNEWGLYKALHSESWTATGKETCDTGTRSTTLDLTADTGFNVTVTCNSWVYNEGESTPDSTQTVHIYRILAVACPAATCPASSAATVAGINYVERSRVVIATH